MSQKDESQVAPISTMRFATAAAVDLRTSGLWSALLTEAGPITLNLSEEGLAPSTMLSVRVEEPAGELPAIRFVSLLDRLGEDGPVALSDDRPERAQVLLRNLLFAAARAWDAASPGGLPPLAFITHSALPEPHLNLIRKLAEAVGWPSVLMTRTTSALAAEALRGAPAGHHLVLSLGHSATEASVVACEPGSRRTLSHVRDTRISGEELDQRIMDRIWRAAAGDDRAAPLGTRAWQWLKRRAESVRRRLNHYSRITVQVPEGLLGDEACEVVFERSEWQASLAELGVRLNALVAAAVAEAQIPVGALASCVASGGLVRQISVLAALHRACGDVPLSVAGRDADLIGAARLAASEGARNAEAGAARRPVERLVHPPLVAVLGSDGAAAPVDPPGGADQVIQRARSLVQAGRQVEAEHELARLKQYVDALELSLKEPAEALKTLSMRSSAAPRPETASRRPDSVAPDTGQFEAVRRDDDETKTSRRDYVRARELIRDAELGLKEGRLEQAVALSHLAYKTSTDGRIFGAMIEVHLRACRKKPPAIDNFSEHATWLRCAFRDDPTNETVQEAVRTRYLTHVEQLLTIGTAMACEEARKTLAELAAVVEPGERAAPLHQRIEAGQDRLR